MNPAVAYLESAEYEAHGWEHGIPDALMQLRDTVECHRDLMCENEESLCTGDGYRWHPILPALRFT